MSPAPAGDLKATFRARLDELLACLQIFIPLLCRPWTSPARSALSVLLVAAFSPLDWKMLLFISAPLRGKKVTWVTLTRNWFSLLESWHVLDFLGTTKIRICASQTAPISYTQQCYSPICLCSAREGMWQQVNSCLCFKTNQNSLWEWSFWCPGAVQWCWCGKIPAGRDCCGWSGGASCLCDQPQSDV